MEYGRPLYFCPVSSSSFFPRLNGRRLDVYHTSTQCGPSANLECRSEMCCMRLAGNAGPKKSPSGHHHTTLSCYIFATKARLDNRGKNLLNSNVSPTSSQHGELQPTSGWDLLASLGHPSKFQRVLRLGSITARHLVAGVNQTLRRWTEGTTYIPQGGHHVEHWPTF